MGHDDKFYNLLEASAAEAQVSIDLLAKLLRDPRTGPGQDDFVEARQKHKRISEDITEQLCTTFVTPLEREDIESLSNALYKIPKAAEKFSEKFFLTRHQLDGIDFLRQVGLLQQSVGALVTMVMKLRRRVHLEEMKDDNARMHRFEHDADIVMLELLKDLYSGRHDPLKVIIVRDLYETIEKIIDRCRDVGNVIFQVVLKYS